MDRPKRQTVKGLAAEIQRRWPDLRVTVERGHCNTDRKIGRLRWPGKGRWGTRVIVRDPNAPNQTPGEEMQGGRLLLDHNNAETYRRTEDVADWMASYERDRKKKK